MENSAKAEAQKLRERHIRWYMGLRNTAGKLLVKFLRFEGEPVCPGDGPFILLCNHNTDLDPIFLGTACTKHMYFVASEHLFRKGFVSRVVEWVFGPIHRMKGSTDASAAMDIIRRSRHGDNIAMFPEGNRSYTGVTGPIFPATGKLVRTAGATLYTYRLEGGYLRTPRWGKNKRKGPLQGRLIGIYPPEELKKMTPEEINELIQRDIMEDAFVTQQTQNSCYEGKDLAEYLEAALYICPKCGKLGFMHSHGELFVCTACGYESTFTRQGTFAGKDILFDTVRDWDLWQTKKLGEYAKDGLTLSDPEASLHLWGDGSIETKACGPISMDREKLIIGDLSFPLDDITGMGLIARARINFTYGGEHYEVVGSAPDFCGRKYFALYNIYKENQ